MIPEGVDSGEAVEKLLRILRRYADGPVGPPLAAALWDLHQTGVQGLVAFEKESDERVVESVLAGIHRQLVDIVMDLRLEIGSARVEGVNWLEDLDPRDFGEPQ